jgi:FkbM family methyltransferase
MNRADATGSLHGQPIPDLVYDVGVNDGCDSAYYLHKGYRVVGVEANPLAAELLRRRFATEFRQGRYFLVEAGIAADKGAAEFWVCDSHPDWSSFDRTIASRDNAVCHAETVRTLTFQAILTEYGMPYFCKIDIEGNDHLCLAALRPEWKPSYLSIEMSHEEGGRDLLRLRELGYRRFKLISQVSRAQPLRPLMRVTTRLRPGTKARLLRLEGLVRGSRRDESWLFSPASSGAFGELTSGRWKGWSSVYKDWALLNEAARRWSHMGEWYDIHAAI